MDQRRMSMVVVAMAGFVFASGWTQAAGPPPGFQINVRNQTGGQIKVAVYNNDDAVRYAPAQEAVLEHGSEAALKCNTNESCWVKTMSPKPIDVTTSRNQVPNVVPLYDGNFAMAGVYNFKAPCLLALRQDQSKPYGNNNARATSC